MDHDRFDDLARRLGSGGSRRGFLKTLGVVAASVFGLERANEAEAARTCTPGLLPCNKNTDCCSGDCLSRTVVTWRGKRTVHICALCKSESYGKTCTGKCGVVTNNCGLPVPCGKCNCKPHSTAKTCKGKCGTVTDNCGSPVQCPACPCKPDTTAVTCSGKCGQIANNCGTVVDCGVCPCAPDDVAVTCSGWCGTVLNNCNQPVDCGICEGGTCSEGEFCNGGDCVDGKCCGDANQCEDFCCSAERSERDVCCPGTGECCECFQDRSPSAGGSNYCGCPASRELCGVYPNDQCCQPFDTCVDGACTPKQIACPPMGDPGGANIRCDAACCGAVCCTDGWVCDGTHTCVPALATCVTQSDCANGQCTGQGGNAGFCCPGYRAYPITLPDDNGGEVLVYECCSPSEEARGCTSGDSPLYCTPVTYSGCETTFRGSQPRVGH